MLALHLTSLSLSPETRVMRDGRRVYTTGNKLTFCIRTENSDFSPKTSTNCSQFADPAGPDIA